MELSALHRDTAATFTSLVDGVTDWDAPTPVAEWRARDIVGHLTTWLPGLLGSAGVHLPSGPSADDDPVAAWRHQTESVQALLDDPAAVEQVVEMPGGAKPVSEVLAQFYEPDIFMHAWDLARASGQDFHLDEERCAGMYAGMSQIEPMLRESGQFGQRIDVPDDASAEDRFIGFIGRDPHWQPPA